MKGILFKPNMIKAIVEGRKTQTWRVIKPQPPARFVNRVPDMRRGVLVFADSATDTWEAHPRYDIGEIVYIKEAWSISYFTAIYEEEHQVQVSYKDGKEVYFTVDYETWEKYATQKYCSLQSPMFLPECFARYFIQITDVRAERLQEITEEDAGAEGCTMMPGLTVGGAMGLASARYVYMRLWNTINKSPYDWQSNPWCWVYSFKAVEP